MFLFTGQCYSFCLFLATSIGLRIRSKVWEKCTSQKNLSWCFVWLKGEVRGWGEAGNSRRKQELLLPRVLSWSSPPVQALFFIAHFCYYYLLYFWLFPTCAGRLASPVQTRKHLVCSLSLFHSSSWYSISSLSLSGLEELEERRRLWTLSALDRERIENPSNSVTM